MRRALHEFRVVGISTTIPFCQFVLADSEFKAGRYTTHFVEERFTTASDGTREDDVTGAAIAAALFFTQGGANAPGRHERTGARAPRGGRISERSTTDERQ